MIKQKLSLIFIIFLLTSISATIYYPGETKIFENEMGIDNLVYTIIGNSSYIGDLNLIINSTNISVTFPQDMIPDRFEIVFIEEQIKEITNTVYVGGGGGGGGSSKTIYKNITEYKDVIKTEYNDRIVRGEDNFIKTPVEVQSKAKFIYKLLSGISLIIILLLLLWIYYSRNKENYIAKKEVKEYE